LGNWIPTYFRQADQAHASDECLLVVAARHKRKQQATRLHITAAKSGTSKHSKQHAPVAASTSQLTAV
jgi:hypothetical protein